MLSTVATAVMVVAGTGCVDTVVPVSAAQARAEAPFCSRLKPGRCSAVPGCQHPRQPPRSSAAGASQRVPR